MEAKITRVLPVYPHSTFIQWTLEDPENSSFYFEVLRSGSPSGPFEVVSGVIPDTSFSFLDSPADHFGLTNHSWYAIKVTPKSGPANAFVSKPVAPGREWTGLKGRLGRKARHDLDILLEKLNGVPLLAIKRRRFGQRCSVCFNPRTKDSVFSSCDNCYSTTFEGGYHTPVKTWGKVDPVVVSQNMDLTGVTETAMFGITMPDYPMMEAEDIVVETRTNRRFVVKQKVSTEHRRVCVHQDLQVSELSRSDAAYQLPLTLVE
jgi:hypothetical protein